MKHWKIGVMTVAALAGLSLTACGKGSSDSNSKDITMWVHFSNTDPEGKALAKNIKDFNKTNKHGYHATVKYIPRSGSGGGYEDKVNAAVNSGSLPDVLTLDGPNTAAYANAKIIQPVGQYITNKDDILSNLSRTKGLTRASSTRLDIQNQVLAFTTTKRCLRQLASVIQNCQLLTSHGLGISLTLFARSCTISISHRS
jgi:fructooligosaccharide transport system substrate-binding protein